MPLLNNVAWKVGDKFEFVYQILQTFFFLLHIMEQSVFMPRKDGVHMGRNFDREMAKRVWERVQAAQPEVPVLPPHHTDALQGLIVEEWQEAESYGQLSRQLSGKQEALLQKLYQQKKAQISCLKGIYAMVAGSLPVIHAKAPQQEPPERMLRRCYGRQMRCLAQYEARSTDPEYGPIYAKLAQQNRNHCHALLELIGSLKK